VLLVSAYIPIIYSIYSTVQHSIVEREQGAIDLILRASESSRHSTLNMNKIEKILQELDEKYKRCTPRIEFESSAFSEDGAYFDSDRENDLDVGRAWVFIRNNIIISLSSSFFFYFFDLPRLEEGYAYISERLSRQLHVFLQSFSCDFISFSSPLKFLPYCYHLSIMSFC
jgi:hypothetical protein